MSDQLSEPSTAAFGSPEPSDALLARLLGRDLQTATLRSALYLVIAAAVFATIGVLIR
jgi:hypothetical protein